MNKTIEMLEIEQSVENGTNCNLQCEVCGDQATGRHYGTIACNGCKGFFRRTIRRGYKYVCRFTNSCNIDKHNRAVCRSCRYLRCINAGMKIEAVQNQRDVIGRRQKAFSSSNPMQVNNSTMHSDIKASRLLSSAQVVRTNQNHSSAPSTSMTSRSQDLWDNPKTIIDCLLKSENKVKSMRETVIKQTGAVKYSSTKEIPGNIDNFQRKIGQGERKATVNDIFTSLQTQLLLVIEWAKTLPPFTVLSTEDQTALLKNFACQHVILCVSYRSKNSSNFLKLINDSCIPRFQETEHSEFPDNVYLRDCERVMDELVAPMRYLEMDDIEFVAMKACVLFNPVAKGLSEESIMLILSTRRKIFAALEHYVSTRMPNDPNRIGDLTFFVLSPLQSLAAVISEDILVSKLSGVAHIDQLMEELILADAEEHKVAQRFQSGIVPTENDANRVGGAQYCSFPSRAYSTTTPSVPTNTPNSGSPSAMGDLVNGSQNFNFLSTSNTTYFGAFNSTPSPSSPMLMNSSVDSPSLYSSQWGVLSSSSITENDPMFTSTGMSL